MTTQTVFRLTSGDGLARLREFQEPIPTIRDYEVLIKVHSVGLNYRDISIANNTYLLPTKDNVVPCSDMSGEVVELGRLARGFAVGDAVVVPLSPVLLYGGFNGSADTFGGTDDGMLSEYVALPAHVVVKLPETTHSFTQWAALPCTGATVWNAFYGNVPLKPGDTVLLLGTGGLSLTALVFAKAAGATTIITSSSDEKLESVRSRFGVDHTINYTTHPNWAAEVRSITNGRGVDHVLDVTGMATMRQSLDSVAYGGVVSVASLRTNGPEDDIPNVAMMAHLKACVVRGILGGSKQQLEEAVRFVGNRGLSLPVDKTFDFNRDGIIAALEYVASGKHIGKVCINLG